MRMAGSKPWRYSVPFYITVLVSLNIFTYIVYGQTSYYVAANGDDGNSGTSRTSAWRTIAKVNSVTFASGDAVYFRGSGDRFYGQIAIN
ncbi:MAG: hypothetical protein JXA06_08260, partial [Bacteroidetes bacterium]|nr:hypothetical protein [Bacteroidota bacterium]